MKLFPSINPVIAGGAGRIFGPGPAELLARTRATGSLHAAAAEMGMAYSKATRIIRTAEDGLGHALLERKRGGTAGGGSALTFEAELLLARYDAWRTEAAATAESLYERRFSRLGCVVMASGESRRFGSNKLTAPFAGSTVLEHTLAALPSDLLDVRVVTRSADVAALAESCGATAVLHDGPLQSDTIRAGLAAIGDAPACLFVPGDQPLLSEASVRALVLTAAENPDAIIRLAHDGAPGSPGELCGSSDESAPIGSVARNTSVGIFGHLTVPAEGRRIQTGELRPGEASILATLSGREARAYSAQIDRVYSDDGVTHALLTVTDGELTADAGGIVQGMSGSPIIQDGALVGAVTHVFVNDPRRGFAVGIYDMLSAAGVTEQAA